MGHGHLVGGFGLSLLDYGSICRAGRHGLDNVSLGTGKRYSAST